MATTEQLHAFMREPVRMTGAEFCERFRFDPVRDMILDNAAPGDRDGMPDPVVHSIGGDGYWVIEFLDGDKEKRRGRFWTIVEKDETQSDDFMACVAAVYEFDRAEFGDAESQSDRMRRVCAMALSTPHDCHAWIRALHAEGISWHFDDDAAECFDDMDAEVAEKANACSDAVREIIGEDAMFRLAIHLTNRGDAA